MRSCAQDDSSGHRVRRLVLWVVAGAAALGFWWREHPSPCPYGLRVWLVLPRPVITWRRLIDILSPREGERMLEIGAGTGYYALRVAERVGKSGRLDALDIQQSMLDHLATRARERGLGNVVTTVCDAHALPFEDDTFDGVYLSTVLGEIIDQDLALAEMYRVLRPGGRLVDGECLGDPLMVFPENLCQRATAAGFSFVRRVGVPLAYFALFRKEARDANEAQGS